MACSFLLAENETGLVSSPQVDAVDTTAAGDTFNGALLAALDESKPIMEAVDFTCKAAALSVTRLGAQSSIPTLAEFAVTYPDLKG